VANVVPSTNYSIVAKTGSNLNTILSQTTKDIQGDIIRNGVAYNEANISYYAIMVVRSSEASSFN
jgi:hypothetical protein